MEAGQDVRSLGGGICIRGSIGFDRFYLVSGVSLSSSTASICSASLKEQENWAWPKDTG
jgi:hypothetical protein